MALVNYMGDAPGFMSYRRKPNANFTNIPQRTAPQQPQFQGPEFDMDLEANPGDKQALYDRHASTTGKIRELYNKYGGQMDWVQADPEYTQVMRQNRYDVYDRQAAKQNKVNTDKRIKDLASMNSGQHNSDIELQMQNGMYIPKAISTRGGFVKKGEYSQDVIANPQYFQRDDGSTGIQHTEFDYGTGSQKEFHSVLDNVFAGDSRIGINKHGSKNTTGEDFADTKNLKYAVQYFSSSAHENANNYQQLQDATQYLIDYGMDDNQRYFLAQSFYKDIEAGKGFTVPVYDKDGIIKKTKDGRVQYQNYYVKPEDLQDTEKMSSLFNAYTQDRIRDYQKKFRKSDVSSERDTRTGYENYIPGQGAIEETPEIGFWTSVKIGQGPKNNATTKEVYKWDEDESGNQYYRNMGAMSTNVYDWSNAGSHMEQVQDALKGKTLEEISRKGVYAGGRYQDLGKLGKAKIGSNQVLSVEEVPMYELGKDGNYSTKKFSPEDQAKYDNAQKFKDSNPEEYNRIMSELAPTTLAAKVRIYMDDDQKTGGLQYVDHRTMTSESMFNVHSTTVSPLGLVGTGSGHVEGKRQAQDRGLTGMIPREELPEGVNILGDEGDSWRDSYGDEVNYVDVYVPIEDQLMIMDQENVGETRRATREQQNIQANREAFKPSNTTPQVVNQGQGVFVLSPGQFTK